MRLPSIVTDKRLQTVTVVWCLPVCSYFLSLSLAPTAVIGLDQTLKAPKFDLTCNARPSLFAYPPPVTTEASKEVRLSTV